MNNKIAIIESVALEPHLETSGEIAIDFKKKNHEVVFFWAGYDLSWHDWDIDFISKILGGSINKKVVNFENILSSRGIKVRKIDNDIDSNNIKIWSDSFCGNLNKLKNYKYKNCNLGIGVASSLISYFNDYNFNPILELKKVRSLLFCSALIYERVLFFLKIENPNKVLTFNGRFATCLPIVRAAEKLKIQVLRHERGSNFDKYEIYQNGVHDINYIQKKVSYYWRNNKNKNKIIKAQSFFNLRINRKPIGVDQGKVFVSNQKKGLLPELPANKRIVVFYTTSNHEYAAVSNFEFNQIQAFKKMLKVINNFPDIYLVIRVHPNNNRKNNIDDKLWTQFSNYKKICVITSQDAYDTYALMIRADIVVSYSSTIALEASYFGKPSVVLKKFWWTQKKSILLIDNIRDLSKIFNKNYKFKKIKKTACLPVANYILNYGKKFRYYKPESFYKGKFLGQTLTWKSYLIRFFELFSLNFYYLFLKKKFLYFYNTYL